MSARTIGNRGASARLALRCRAAVAGGQAGWLTAHLDAGSGMNALARVPIEMFEAPPGAG